jgi:hypothetical protein
MYQHDWSLWLLFFLLGLVAGFLIGMGWHYYKNRIDDDSAVNKRITESVVDEPQFL